MSKWWHDHGRWLTALAITLSLAGTALLPVLIIRMPADYFTRTDPPPTRGPGANVWRARLAALAVKNVAGIGNTPISIRQCHSIGLGSLPDSCRAGNKRSCFQPIQPRCNMTEALQIPEQGESGKKPTTSAPSWAASTGRARISC